MPQQNQRAAELNHAKEVDGVAFPAAGEPAEVFQPGKQPLDFPAVQVAAQWPSILRALAFLLPVGRNQLDPWFASQPFVQRVAVVGPIPDHALRHGGDVALAERVFDQFRLMWRSACNPHGERKTMAVRDCHDLAPFAAARWTNAIAPFLAPMNEASMKVSSSPSWPRANRSSQSAHRIPSRTPARCHCWKRRWQVWYGPYRAGRSCQGRAGTQNPEHTIEHPACIAPGATASIAPPLLVPLYQGPEMFPLPVAEISHAPDLLQLRP